MILLAARSVIDEGTGDLLGYVRVGILLDNVFARRLAAESGLEQSIFSNGRRVASSLTNNPTGEALENVTTSISGRLTQAGKHYYTMRFPLRRADNEIVALAEVALPVTELVRAERKILVTIIASTLLVALTGSVTAWILRSAVKKESVHHLRSHFLASITHEFRTPLAALRASVEFLVDEMAHLSRPEIDELLRAIHMSVTGLQTLIDNLLESISIEAGNFVIRPEAMELESVVSEAARIMHPLLNRRQQQLNVAYSRPVPLVYGDPKRLVQVMVNLLSNASKYGPMGQPIDLTVATANDNTVRVTVADRGTGISPTKRDHLFRRFSRLNTAAGAQQGIGLGLWVVHAIISEHGGTVGVEERPGGGAIFWFAVPIAPPHIDDD